MCLMNVVWCQVEVSESDSSPIPKSPTECDREASTMRSWPTRGCCAMEKNNNN